MINQRLISAMILGLSALQAVQADDQVQATDYIPKIHGTIRGRYELETDEGEQRFQVRNARLSVTGNVCQPVDYFIQADFCDRGKFKMLDAWARLALTSDLKVQAGQFRVPFSVDAFRAPGTYYFANRSFVAKQVGNLRGVGAKAAYTLSRLPLSMEAGVFNTATISDHEVWQHSMSYAAKTRYTMGTVFIEGGFESIVPDSVRLNLADVTVSWSDRRWIAEGEYIYKHYTHSDLAPTHAYSLFTSYWMPVKALCFNRLSFQARWDGMTDHSTGKRSSDGLLHVTDKARQRITVGTTLTYLVKATRTDLRLNYENYFYHNGVDGPQGERDKIVVELSVKF